jgi:hypothetical protein
MQERNVVVRDNGGSVAAFSIVAVIVVAAVVALFVWQPWNATSTQRTNSTTIQQGSSTGTTGTSTGTTGSGVNPGSQTGTGTSGSSGTTH